MFMYVYLFIYTYTYSYLYMDLYRVYLSSLFLGVFVKVCVCEREFFVVCGTERSKVSLCNLSKHFF